MRTTANLKVYFHELDQPELMVQWGSEKRRKRMKPETLLVEWDQPLGTSRWQLGSVYLMGRYVHAQSSTTISTYLFKHNGPRWADSGGTWSPETPDWVKGLVDKTMPMHRAVVDESQLAH